VFRPTTHRSAAAYIMDSDEEGLFDDKKEGGAPPNSRITTVRPTSLYTGVATHGDSSEESDFVS